MDRACRYIRGKHQRGGWLVTTAASSAHKSIYSRDRGAGVRARPPQHLSPQTPGSKRPPYEGCNRGYKNQQRGVRGKKISRRKETRARPRDPRCDIFCMRLRLTRTSTQNDHSIAACRGMARVSRAQPTFDPHRDTCPDARAPPIHGRAFCAPGISNLYSTAFAGRAVMACAALGGARWRPLAAGLRQSGVLPPTVQGQS